MTVIEEFVEFIESLESSVVDFHNNIPNSPFRNINLKTLTKNIQNYSSIHDWIKSLNLTDHLKKNIILTILEINPPESVKNELLAEMI